MSILSRGVGTPGSASPSFTLDVRDEPITTTSDLRAALARFLALFPERIDTVVLSPVQEDCIRTEMAPTTYTVKEDRPYTVEELGPLQQFLGYTVVIQAEEDE